MKLIIVRHGHTDALENNIVQGHRTGGLNELGKKQAAKVAQRLAAEKIDIMYSSDLDRAVETTKAIQKNHPHLDVKYDQRLRENNTGIYEGKPRAEMIAAREATGVDWKHWRPEEGESFEDLFVRVKGWFKDVATKHRGQTVLVVAHGGVIRSLLTFLFDGPNYRFNPAFGHENTGLTVIDLEDSGQPKILLLNSTAHLDDEHDRSVDFSPFSRRR